MKKILILLLMSFAAYAGHAQRGTDSSSFKSAVFPGGEDAWFKYLGENMKVPENTGDAPGGQVTVKFIIKKNGKIGAVEVIESAGTVFDKVVIKVVKNSPAWTPAMRNGKNISSEQTATAQFAAPMEIKL